MTASVESISELPHLKIANATLRAEKDPVACSPVSIRSLELARRVAMSDCTVLIAGESGTGKEVLARFIHRQSPRKQGAFVAINCAAIPENMLEAMLFGYERGAFTGAHTAHAGKFEQAQGGTLLLDEVSEMSLPLQAKLLRVLQEREVERLGGRSAVSLDVRVLATTNRQLRSEVASGKFREDLYYRLNVFPLLVAPLRARRDDILPLAMRLLEARCRPGERIPALNADAAHMLLTYSWPGNVRELDNVMQRALILSSVPPMLDEQIESASASASTSTSAVEKSNVTTVTFVATPVIGPEHIQFENDALSSEELSATEPVSPSSATGSPPPLADTLEQAEQDLILQALRAGNGNRQLVAEKLGISPRTLRYKLARLRELGIAVPAA